MCSRPEAETNGTAHLRVRRTETMVPSPPHCEADTSARTASLVNTKLSTFHVSFLKILLQPYVLSKFNQEITKPKGSPPSGARWENGASVISDCTASPGRVSPSGREGLGHPQRTLAATAGHLWLVSAVTSQHQKVHPP